MGETIAVKMIFGQEKVEPILRLTALESVGFRLIPATSASNGCLQSD
jgi:hypothetical protein